MRSERVEFLDALRAIAALMVFVIHACMPPEGSIINFGRYGVTVFFVVSAFSLCLSLSREDERGKIRWGAYFVRRFFRIAPLYYAVLLFGAVEYLQSGKGFSLLVHLTFANVFVPEFANDLISVEWTIAVEWGFYVALPVLFVFTRFPLALVGLAGASLLLWAKFYQIVVWTGSPVSVWYCTLPAHLYAFVAGIAAFWLVRNYKLPATLAWAAALTVAVIASVELIIGENRWSGPAFALMTALAIVCCWSQPAAARVLSLRPLVWIGTISYSVYLLHILVLGHFVERSMLNVFGALAVTVALSSVTYFAIEEPGRMLGRWITKERTRVAIPAE
jgi:peptidoglycan/LPS O-acetylase OafA/YrhL